MWRFILRYGLAGGEAGWVRWRYYPRKLAAAEKLIYTKMDTVAYSRRIDMSVANVEKRFAYDLTAIHATETTLLTHLNEFTHQTDHTGISAVLDLSQAQTEGHIKRLEIALDILGRPSHQTDGNPGVDPVYRTLLDAAGHASPDTATVAATTAFEHYQIAAYSTLTTMAAELGYTDIAGKLQQTLKEEEATLTALKTVAGDLDSHTAR